jgi:hypothetical protein
MSNLRPELKVAVVMRRERTSGPTSHWQPWRWVLAEVVPHEDGFGTAPRCLYKNDNEESWLHPDFTVELFKDDAEGYYLNATTQAPGWFVLWRMEEELGLAEELLAKPVKVSLSYYDAGRWLDAQEFVEPAVVVEWLQAFVDEHFVAEPRRRKRPESFRSLTDRFGSPASISTEKQTGNGRGRG